jgi:hypothetical protein
MKKSTLALLIVCLAALLAMGCEKKGYLGKMGNTRLGVVLESDKPVDSTLSGFMAEQIRRNTKATVIDMQALPILSEYGNRDTLAKLAEEQKINYIFVGTLSDKGTGDYSTSVSAHPGDVKANLDYKRRIVLDYKVIAVPSGEIKYTGQCQGEAVRRSSVGWGGAKGDTTARVDLGDEKRIIQDAVQQALSKSGLF